METMKPARATHRDQTMAKNFIQPGRVVTLVAPTGGVVSGQAVQVGALFGVAAFDAVGGTGVEVALEGVWELPKAAVAIARGAPVKRQKLIRQPPQAGERHLVPTLHARND